MVAKTRKIPLRSITVLLLSLAILPGIHPETIRFSAESVESVLASGKESTRLRGDARVQTERVEIHADEIELSGEDNRFVNARGGVYIHEKEKDLYLHGETLFYDREFDILKMSGDAILDDRGNDVLARAGIIENRGRDNISLIQIGVRILRTDLVARAELVRYERDTQILELSGQPVVYSDGDEYRAGRIIVDLETDDIRLEGRVQGLIQDRSQ